MRIPTAAGVKRRLKKLLSRNPDGFLRKVSGVIHVGANAGQERDTYKKYSLRVIWVEPVPEVFQQLTANLVGYPGQLAFANLVTDQDDVEYTFHISNNDAASSSIFDFKLHKEIWPEVGYERAIKLRSTTLTSLLKKEGIDSTQYQALVLDTQGSELLVLKGAEPILHRFSFIKVEVADFESYKDCCQLRDIEEFLYARGFREYFRKKQVLELPTGGKYFDIVYRKTA